MTDTMTLNPPKKARIERSADQNIKSGDVSCVKSPSNRIVATSAHLTQLEGLSVNENTMRNSFGHSTANNGTFTAGGLTLHSSAATKNIESGDTPQPHDISSGGMLTATKTNAKENQDNKEAETNSASVRLKRKSLKDVDSGRLEQPTSIDVPTAQSAMPINSSLSSVIGNSGPDKSKSNNSHKSSNSTSSAVMWSDSENKSLLNAYLMYGTQWGEIHDSMIKTKSALQIEMHWKKKICPCVRLHFVNYYSLRKEQGTSEVQNDLSCSQGQNHNEPNEDISCPLYGISDISFIVQAIKVCC